MNIYMIHTNKRFNVKRPIKLINGRRQLVHQVSMAKRFSKTKQLCTQCNAYHEYSDGLEPLLP